jgi:Tfp pilus assembly protein PilF
MAAQRRASIPAPALARQLELAREHADRNQHEEAHELIDDTLAKDATIVEAYLLRADLYESEHDDRAALEALRCALYLDPELIEAHFRAGLLLERLGDRKGAILALRNAAALERSSIEGGANGLGRLAAMRLTLLLTEDAR